MIYIEECKRKYVEFFPVDWIEKLEWKDRDTSLASYKEGFLRINNFEILCFELLSKSALSGEYINNVDRMPLFFDEIKELTAHEYSSPNPSIQSELRDSLYKEYQILDKNLRICSVQYYRLWSFVSNKIDNFATARALTTSKHSRFSFAKSSARTFNISRFSKFN